MLGKMEQHTSLCLCPWMQLGNLDAMHEVDLWVLWEEGNSRQVGDENQNWEHHQSIFYQDVLPATWTCCRAAWNLRMGTESILGDPLSSDLANRKRNNWCSDSLKKTPFCIFLHSFTLEPPNNTSERATGVVPGTFRSQNSEGSKSSTLSVELWSPRRWGDPLLLFSLTLSCLWFVWEYLWRGTGERSNESPSFMAI